MKRLSIALVTLLLFTTASAQSDSVRLMKAVAALDQALLKQDTAVLNQLLDGDLRFGHSNGWIQSKKDILADFESGKLLYRSLQTSDVQLLELSKDLATIVLKVKAAGKAGDKEFELNLQVMQVWKKDKKGWQLYARQSAKL